MPILYLANTTASYNGSTSATTHSLTINKPTGTAIGDVLLVLISGAEDDGTSRPLSQEVSFSGFTKVTEAGIFSTTRTRRSWVYVKPITSSSEPSSYTFTVTYSSGGVMNMAGIAARFSGIDLLSPVNANSSFDGDTPANTTITFNSVTTTAANTMLAMMGYVRRNLTTTFNDGTKITDVSQAGTATAGGGITSFMGYLVQDPIQASGNKTATYSGGTARENDALIVALNPASNGIYVVGQSNNTIYANSSNVTILGSGLGSGAYAKLVYANQEILMVDYVANSTQPYFFSPSLADVFASRIQFTDSANLQILNAQSGIVATKIVSFQPPTTKTVHNVTDISEILNDGSIYYGQSPAITVNDQIVFDSKSSLTYNVSLDSQGFITIDSLNTDANDSFTYRVYESTAQVWGTEGTITFIGESGAAPYFSNKIKMYIRVV
jgi:hypothetical protein